MSGKAQQTGPGVGLSKLASSDATEPATDRAGPCLLKGPIDKGWQASISLGASKLARLLTLWPGDPSASSPKEN